MTGAASFLAGSIFAKLVLDKSGWTSSVNSAIGEGQKLAGMSSKTAAAFSTMGRTMTLVGATITAALMKTVKAAGEKADALRQLNVVLESTRGIAGVTATEAMKIADAMQAVTTFSDEAVISGENLLLTFTGIGKDVFPAAVETMLNMSTALGQDLKSSAIQLGKALQDPILGVTALRRVGVNFNKDQQELIRTLVQTGHTLEAQKLILAELSTEFGGSAKAAAQGFGGQMKQLQNELHEVYAEIGMQIVPILKDLVAKIKPIIAGIAEWIKAHPELTKQIAGTALKLGLLMTFLGPLLFMVPKIVGAIGFLAGGFKNLFLSLGALGKPLGTVKFGLGQLALVGAAAFVGWNIGKLIGEITGLDHVVEGAAAKLIDLLGVAKAVGELNADNHTEMEARRMEAFARASDLAGKSVTRIQDAMRILVEEYKKHGTTGSAVLDDMAKKWQANVLSVDATKKAHGELNPVVGGTTDEYYELGASLNAAQIAEKAFADFIKSASIITIEEKRAKIEELNGFVKRLNELHASGKIDEENYQAGMNALNIELMKYGRRLFEALPVARDFNNLIKEAPDYLEGAIYGFATFSDTFDYFSDQLKVSPATIQLVYYEIGRLQMLMMGFHLPDLRIPDAPVKEAAKEVRNTYETLFGDLLRGWSSTLEKFISGQMKFKDFFKETWEGIKTSFFRIIADMAVKWVTGFLTDILVKKTAESAAKAAASFTDVATSASSAAGSVGSAISGLATGLASVISALVGAVATGIITLATAIGTAIVTLATAIAAAATALAAAAPALLIVGAIALALYAGFALIGALVGGAGGGGAGDGMGRVVERQDKFLAMFDSWHIDILNIMVYIQGRMDVIVDKIDVMLERIAGGGSNELLNVGWVIADRVAEVSKAISKLRGAQTGHISTQTELLMVHGTPRVPEITIPVNRLGDLPLTARGGASVNMNFAATFEIDAVDGNSVRDIVRAKIGPELIAWIRANIGKQSFREALGV